MQYSGRFANVTINGADKYAFSWSLSSETARVETTNTGDAGYYTSVEGISKCSGSFSVHHDNAEMPHDAPAVFRGSELTNLRMYAGQAVDAGPHFLVETAFVTTCDATSDVNGNSDFTVNWEGTGLFTGWTG